MLNGFINLATFRKGWRTLAFGLITAVTPALFQYLGVVDWTTLGVSPAAGGIIGTIIVALRLATTTPPGASK